MDAGVVALVLLSALLHAGWNIVLKVKGDRLLVMTLIANGASLIALCLIPFAPVHAAQRSGLISRPRWCCSAAITSF